MSAAAALTDSSFDMNQLNYEIFSILESKFLFQDSKLHVSAPPPVAAASPVEYASSTFPAGRVRVLSVDASGTTDGLLAAASLARLESSLKMLSGEPSARVADFFDVAAGSGVGGVLVALLFTRGPAGHPLFSAAEAVDFLARNRRALQPKRKNSSLVLSGIFRRSNAAKTTDDLFRRVFGDATLRDTVKPVLIPCYDLSTRAPFLFSRADAIETDGYNFLMREVCAATVASAKMCSVDGRTAIDAVGGGVATGNPAAAAITHVLNNRMEFPFVTGVDDLLLISLGNGETAAACGRRSEAPRALLSKSRPDIVKIAGDGASDMVDQAVAMAFGPNRTSSYVRIQASVSDSGKLRVSNDAGELLAIGEALLAQNNVESVLFQGRRISGMSNAERLVWASAELVREHEARKKCPIPVVVFKQGSSRSSSSSSLSSCSGSPMPAASPR